MIGLYQFLDIKMIGHLKDVLKGKAPIFNKRSSKWPTVRKHFLETNISCSACGWTQDLEVHHIIPFHVDPSLELNPSNFIVLCDKLGKDNCHLAIGHLGNFKQENPMVKEDAAENLSKSLR